MAGAEEVVGGIDRRDGTVYAGLVLNEQGLRPSARRGLDEVRFALAATESVQPAQRERVRSTRRLRRSERGRSRAREDEHPLDGARSASRSAAPSRAASTRARWSSSPSGCPRPTTSSSRTRSVSRPRGRCDAWSRTSGASGFHGPQHAQHGLRQRATPRSRPARRPLDSSIGGLGGLPVRAQGDAATSPPRISSTCSRATASRPAPTRKALIADLRSENCEQCPRPAARGASSTEPEDFPG